MAREEAREAIKEAYGNSEYTDEIIKALEQEQDKPMVEIDLYSVIKQKYIEREVLDKIRTEIESIDLLAEYTRGDIKRMALATIDKYKAESEEYVNFADT